MPTNKQLLGNKNTCAHISKTGKLVRVYTDGQAEAARHADPFYIFFASCYYKPPGKLRVY